MVFGAFEAFVGHVGSREGRAHADEPRVGVGLTAKKVSAKGWSAVEAQPKQKPVITPVGPTATSREKTSYYPILLDQPMSAFPASHPCPRRFASLASMAELSSVW